MATNDQMRIFKLEQRLLRAEQLVGALQTALAQVAQNQFAVPFYGGGGGGGGAGALIMSPSGGIAGATGLPGTGTPASITGQSLYIIAGGAFTLATSTGNVFNGLEAAVVTTKGCVCAQNPDGTFSVVGQSCV